MNMKQYLYIILLFSTFLSRAQQDAQYNLYQFNPLLINPAYAGAKDVLTLNAAVRNQWSGFDGAPRTTVLSGHAPVLKNKLGLGMTVINDRLGPRNMVAAYAHAAYILRLNRRTKLSCGINAGYNRYQFNYSKLTFFDATESQVNVQQNQNYGLLDINGGLYLKASSYFIGLSATHLTAPSIYDLADPNNSKFIYRLRNHLFLTAGKSFIINQNVIFAPTILLKAVSNTGVLDINFNFLLFKKLWLGAFVRSNYGPGFLLQYYVNSQLKLAYSFDSGSNDARKLGASHEVMIGFEFSKNKSRTVNPRFL